MSRKRTNNTSSKFKRLLGWTVLMAVVFSAGLITGERLVRKQNLAPLVSVTDQVPQTDRSAAQPDGSAEQSEREATALSFFDQLTRREAVALSVNKRDDSEQGSAAQPAAEKSSPPNEAPDTQPSSDEEADDETDARPNEAAAEEPAEPVEEPAEPADPAENPEAKPQQPDQGARYTLQVAAHPDMDSARQHMTRLRKMGLEPHLVSAAIPGKGKFYRVRVGKFQSMDEARSFQGDLERKNSLSTFVSPL